MKKVLKVFCIMAIALMLLVTNYSFATSDFSNVLVSNTIDNNFVLDGALDILTQDEENEIMPISGDIELPANNIESDIYSCEKSISIEENVNGNIYVIGEKINISSEYINGNIFAIAKDIEIKGNVSGSIYVIGENVTIETSSVSTVYAISDNLTLSENANIMNDFNTIAKQINIKGNINRTLNAAIENMNIAQTSEYIAKGNVTYSGECVGKTELLDTINLVKKESDKKEENEKNEFTDKIKSEIANIVSTVVIIAVLYLIIRKKEIEKVDDYAKSIGNGILKGLLFLIVIPIVAFILICTVFGIPLALLVIALYTIGLYISMPIASLKIAEIIYSNTSSSNKAIIILYASGVYVITRIISLVPTIGGLVNFLIVLYGFGSLIRLIFGNKNEDKME